MSIGIIGIVMVIDRLTIVKALTSWLALSCRPVTAKEVSPAPLVSWPLSIAPISKLALQYNSGS